MVRILQGGVFFRYKVSPPKLYYKKEIVPRGLRYECIKKYWICTMVNLKRGRQYFIYGGYITTFEKQVQTCLDTKCPLEYSILKWGGTNHGGGFLYDKLAVRYMTQVHLF